MFDSIKKKPAEKKTDPFAETYFQELQFIDHRKKRWGKQKDEDPLQVLVFWVLIPIFLGSLSITSIIFLSLLF
ncbi:MAG TPA: hypothetical protein VK856_13655 [Anaerolineaceae bacterium]|nr:hypothetical protein [Anaerolineaceae bacterium]